MIISIEDLAIKIEENSSDKSYKNGFVTGFAKSLEFVEELLKRHSSSKEEFLALFNKAKNGNLYLDD